MIVHHLRHTCGHTARDRSLSINQWTQVIIRFTLVPLSFNHRSNVSSPWGFIPIVTRISVRGKNFHLLLIALQQIAQAVGHIVEVDAACVAIAQDWCGAVVTTDDDKAIGLTQIKHIVVRIGCRRAMSLDCLTTIQDVGFPSVLHQE